MPRLTGFGRSLSRLGGGIGTRGPGEKKLETDRRHITKRMEDIKRELETIKNNRSVQRAKREKSEIPVVALPIHQCGEIRRDEPAAFHDGKRRENRF